MRITTFSLVIGAVLAVFCAEPAMAQTERADLCGYVFPVIGYQAEVEGLRISLTANDRLIVNGRVLAENHPFEDGDPPRPWWDSANGASVALTRDYILVRTVLTDCIDFAATWIYVLDRRGTLIASSRVWSEHDEFQRFNADPEGLTFSSSFYCGEYSGAAAGHAMVYVLRPGTREFVREERPWNAVCGEDRERSVNAAYFARMQPVSPTPAFDSR